MGAQAIRGKGVIFHERERQNTNLEKENKKKSKEKLSNVHVCVDSFFFGKLLFRIYLLFFIMMMKPCETS
jgi:Ca2+-dependent lipid-binding protein